ncbi:MULTISPECIES: response regulator [Methylosinus]|nr:MULTISPECIES: response regulator [Methylosinus]
MLIAFLSRFSVATKITGGFGLLVCLLVSVATVSYQGLTSARRDFVEYRKIALQNNALSDLQSSLDEIRLRAGDWLLDARDDSVRRLRAEADRLGPLVTDAIRQFERNRPALDTLKRIEADGRDYVATFLQVVALSAPRAVTPNENDAAGSTERERDRLARDLRDRLGPTIEGAVNALKRANLVHQGDLGPQATSDVEQTATNAVIGSVIAILLGLVTAAVVSTAIVRPITAMTKSMRRLAEGDLSVAIPARDRRDELGVMAAALQFFKEALIRRERRRALNAELAELSIALQLAASPAAFADALLNFLAPQLSMGLALFYVRDAGGETFQAVGGYACDPGVALRESFAIGEGLPGQCVASRRTIIVEGLPTTTRVIGSGLTSGPPDIVVCVPVSSAEGVLGVLEFARYGAFEDSHKELLDLAMPIVGLNLGLLQRNLKTVALLERTRLQAEELRAQTDELQASEEELRLQREELQIANDRLVEKKQRLEAQAEDLAAARRDAERQVEELAEASRYKSQFLANMSHELRTPLNSILILADTLADDDELDAEHTESAKVIGESGHHLLALINDILDLSKIEAGRLELVEESVRIDDALASIARTFAAPADRKGVALTVETAPGAPSVIRADGRRLIQVLLNLVGNAVKFTDRGEVRVTASPMDGGVRFSVSDTGVGIAPNQIESVFTAFQQVDGTTSRRYGGTGLGLTISRDLVTLMGGRIEVQSILGQGSVFSFILPNGVADDARAAVDENMMARPTPPSAVTEMEVEPGERTILLVEADPDLAALLAELISGRGYRVSVASSGAAALAAAARAAPSVVLLDLDLHDMSGLDALRGLKSAANGAKLPVAVITGDAEAAIAAKAAGALETVDKPVKRDDIFAALTAMMEARVAASGRRRVLVVDDSASDAHALRRLFRRDAIDIVVAGSGDEAMHRLTDTHFDAVILDLMLPDMSGFTLLERVHAEPGAHPPVVVYSAHDLTTEDIYRLRTFAESIVFKGRAHSRLREEVLQAIEEPNGDLVVMDAPTSSRGRRVLVVDDDPRNLLALSKGLRANGFDVEVAADGAKALAMLTDGAVFDIVLTDIMMPDMDGYELIRRMRSLFARVPIVAVTAKAMPGDAEQCIRSGATAYLSKPIDLDRLLTAMDQWLI